MSDFDQGAYWVNRHEIYRGDILSVGRSDLDKEGNKRAEHVFLRGLGRALDLVQPKTALDVGCGYGRAAPLFLDRGCSYTGVDISPVAIEDARAPGRFIVADLNRWDTKERFDLVAALYVFIHFTDDSTWLSLVEQCLTWVAPGGSLLIANRFPRQIEHFTMETKLRPIGDYAAVFAKHGFRLDREFESLVANQHFRLARAPQRPNGAEGL